MFLSLVVAEFDTAALFGRLYRSRPLMIPSIVFPILDSLVYFITTIFASFFWEFGLRLFEDFLLIPLSELGATGELSSLPLALSFSIFFGGDKGVIEAAPPFSGAKAIGASSAWVSGCSLISTLWVVTGIEVFRRFRLSVLGSSSRTVSCGFILVYDRWLSEVAFWIGDVWETLVWL